MEPKTIVWIIWHILGVIGFILYCSNSNIRPKKKGLLAIAFWTHTFFGLIGLFYGYVCFSGRNKKIQTVENSNLSNVKIN